MRVVVKYYLKAGTRCQPQRPSVNCTYKFNGWRMCVLCTKTSNPYHEALIVLHFVNSLEFCNDGKLAYLKVDENDVY